MSYIFTFIMYYNISSIIILFIEEWRKWDPGHFGVAVSVKSCFSVNYLSWLKIIWLKKNTIN